MTSAQRSASRSQRSAARLRPADEERPPCGSNTVGKRPGRQPAREPGLRRLEVDQVRRDRLDDATQTSGLADDPEARRPSRGPVLMTGSYVLRLPGQRPSAGQATTTSWPRRTWSAASWRTTSATPASVGCETWSTRGSRRRTCRDCTLTPRCFGAFSSWLWGSSSRSSPEGSGSSTPRATTSCAGAATALRQSGSSRGSSSPARRRAPSST